MTNLHSPRRNHHRPPLITVSVATVLTAVLSLGVSHAQVAVPSTVVLNAGIYTYSYSVMNNGPTFDLAVVTLPVAPGSNLMNLTSPSGFDISFDSGVGLVSFLEDANSATPLTFSPASTRGLFSFTSTVAPASVTFEALDANGMSFFGTTISPAIPEPGIMSLLGATLLAPAFLARRRRKAAEPALKNPLLN